MTEVVLDGEDLSAVSAVQAALVEQVALLGAARLEYLHQERALEAAAQELRTRRDEVVLAVARRLDAEAGRPEGNWNFDPSTMTLARRP